MAREFELLVLYTSTPGFHVDVKMAEMMKDCNPALKVCFVGPPVTVEPDKVLEESAIDFVVRREFDHQIVAYATGTPLEDIPGVSFRKDGQIRHNPEGPVIENPVRTAADAAALRDDVAPRESLAYVMQTVALVRTVSVSGSKVAACSLPCMACAASSKTTGPYVKVASTVRSQ